MKFSTIYAKIYDFCWHIICLYNLGAIITAYLGYGLFKKDEQVNLKRFFILKKYITE